MVALAVLVLLLVLSFILPVLYFNTKISKKRLPPSPLRLPVIGNFYLVGTLAHRSFHSLSKRYGDLMLLHFGNAPVLVASSPESAREIMKTQDLCFASRPRLSIPERLLYSCRDVAFAAYGEHWRLGRSICVLQLLNNKRIQSFRCIREEETSLMVEKIRRLSSSPPSVVNLSEVFMQLTNDVVCLAALGRKYGDGDGDGERDTNQTLHKFIKLIGTFNMRDFVPWLGWINRINGVDAEVEEVFNNLDQFLEVVIRDHRENKVSGDAVTNFVEVLLEIQRESKDSAAPVEDELIKALILDMFAAGTDTTFTALEWTVAELIRNPRTMKLLQKEVRDVSRNNGGNNRIITEDDLDKMPYLKAVCKETLRLHPPFPFALPRELTQDTKLLGYDIPRGTLVLVNNWSIQRDPSSWEDPEEFRPERFFQTNIDYKGLHFEMLPFGAGRRGCPGITFAMCVYELALSKLVNEFEFGLPNNVEDLDMTEAPGVVVHKKSPLLIVATTPTCI